MYKNSTPFMENYIKEVFNIVTQLYKSVAPELLSEAFGIDIEEISKLNDVDVMKRLNNLKIDYQSVTTDNEKKIQYHDSIKLKILSQITNQSPPKESDILYLHLNEPDVVNQTSVEDIKKTRNSDGMSKMISDIDYISHEIAHAFEHILLTKNPSFIDSNICILMNSKKKNLLDYDPGESFAISMEKIILDKLKEPGQLVNYGISQYATVSDIDDVWNKKRVIPFSKKGIIGKTSNENPLTYLDLNLTPYRIIKNSGMKEMVHYIKNVNLLEIYESIFNTDDKTMTTFCDQVLRNDYSDSLIPQNLKYKPVHTPEKIIMLLDKMQQSKNVHMKHSITTENNISINTPEKENKLSFTQKIAKFLEKHESLMNIPIFKNFVRKQLNTLPPARNQEGNNVSTLNSRRNDFINELSNNGKFLKIQSQQTNEERHNLGEINKQINEENEK